MDCLLGAHYGSVVLLVATILFLFALMFGFAVVVSAYAYVWIWIANFKNKAALRKLGRVLSLKEAKARIARGEGILIADNPSIGWNVSRVWWSARTDFIPQVEVDHEKEMVSAGDVENHARFIDMKTGAACLVDGFVISQRIERYLKKHFGLERCGYVPTGCIYFERQMRKAEAAVEEK